MFKLQFAVTSLFRMITSSLLRMLQQTGRWGRWLLVVNQKTSSAWYASYF